MKDKDILDVLEQNYKHTIILYPFENDIYCAEQNLGSSLNTTGKKISQHVVEVDQLALRGKKNFMSEIYRVFKNSEEGHTDGFLMSYFFSFALELAFIQGTAAKKVNYEKSKKDTHYIFIVPTEWEQGIEKKILSIFRNAGLIYEEDHQCKLLFYTELDVMLEYLQETEKKLELESGREYILWRLDPINENRLTMTYNCFEASDLRANNRRGEELKQYGGNALRDPVSVYSNNKVYSLAYIDAIGKSVWTFLQDKKIIALFTPADMKEEKGMVLMIDILIGAALTCYLEKLKNTEDLSKLSEVYPFEDFDLSRYGSILTSEELLKSIDMFEIHEIMFRDNEAVIEEVLNDIMAINDDSRRSIKTRRRIVLADNFFRNVTRVIKLPGKLNKYPSSKRIPNGEERNDIKKQPEVDLNKLYIQWIHCFILKFKNDPKYETLLASTNLPYRCIYDVSDMTHYAALKFKNTAAFLITRLSPLLLSLPCSYKKERVLKDSHFTKKSNPEYIVKIDVKLFESSTFSCVQLDYHGKKGSVKAILTDENCADNNYMSLPALSAYFNTKPTDEFLYTERIYITARLLEIINTHFKYALDYFSKYDRQISKNERLFSLEDERLDSNDKATLNEDNNYLLFRSFDDMVPEIKVELKKSDGKEEISQQRYIRVFLMIYLGVLKYNIITFLEKKKIGKKKGDAADENTIIGYTILVDAFFFHTYLKESHSSLVELAIASGFARNEEDCKANVRVITDREEQLLPILEQKLGTNLPLKSFYVHGRLYESYLHITLNQVVIEGLLPDQDSKNIVIKSKVITMPYLFDMVCDNLWNAAQSYNCIIPDADCKHHNKDRVSLQEFSLTELEGFKDKFLHYAKRLLFADSISKSNGISIPISNACGCKLYFGSEDIFDLGIIPAIKCTVSVLTGAITNEDIFGLYGIECFFVTFNYFTSVFHRSYQEYFEYNLKRLIDINLEKKRLKIPYIVFPGPIGGLLQPVINESCILANSFLYGNILQVFGETYRLTLRDGTMYYRDFKAEGYRMMEEKGEITIVEKGKIVPKTRIIEKALYFRSDFLKDDSSYPEFGIIKRGSSNNNTNDAPEQPERLLEDYMVDHHWVTAFKKMNYKQQVYIPLYITVKYLNHSSSVMLSIQVGTGSSHYEEKYGGEETYSNLPERLTIMNIQSK